MPQKSEGAKPKLQIDLLDWRFRREIFGQNLSPDGIGSRTPPGLRKKLSGARTERQVPILEDLPIACRRRVEAYSTASDQEPEFKGPGIRRRLHARGTGRHRASHEARPVMLPDA